MRKPLIVLLSLSVLFLSACSHIKKQTVIGDQEKAYRNAVSVAPLQVPKDLSSSKIGTDTEALPSNIPTGVLKEAPLPPGSLADQIATGKTPKSALNVKLPEPK
jgi:uncharacterized lipoprotein